jgi:hypothetical protein
MKRRSLASFACFSFLAASGFAAAHCGSGDPPQPYGATTASTVILPSAGDGGFYAPSGCSYVFNPSRPFLNYALDTATAPDADAGDPTPQLVRLGLRGDTTKGATGYADPTTTAAVLWGTAGYNTNARVRFGTSPSALTQTQTGFVYTNPATALSPAVGSGPMNFHEVDLCGLTPGTTYYYQAGGGAPGQEVWSATQSFTTVPATEPITVAVFGDARDTQSTWQLVHERMVDANPAILLISGDIVDIGIQEILFTDWLTDIWHDPNDATKFLTLGQFIMVPISGNHENDSMDFFANFPIPGQGAEAQQYASFDIGNTHFVLIDDNPTANNEATAPAIVSWLESDLALADADRAKHPFIVTVSHRGMFSTSEHAADSDVLLTRQTFAPIFDKYHVDLVLNGHDHEYERTYPLNAGNPASGAPVIKSSTSQGTTYVINAGAGADPYAVGSSNAAYRATSTGFGALGVPANNYLGCYALLTLSGTTLTLTAHGMIAGNGGVADDPVIDTITFGQ